MRYDSAHENQTPSFVPAVARGASDLDVAVEEARHPEDVDCGARSAGDGEEVKRGSGPVRDGEGPVSKELSASEIAANAALIAAAPDLLAALIEAQKRLRGDKD